MKPGTKVSWVLKDGSSGTGTIICPGQDTLHSLVAVDPIDPTTPANVGRKFAQSSLEFHPVIHCTNTWLHELGA